MMKSLTVNISGMHCDACVSRVKQSLETVPGVDVEDVQVGTAKMKYDEAIANPAAIQAAIRKIGFEIANIPR
jgi:copper chaperone CopZ